MFLQKEILNAIMQMPRSILDLPLHGPPTPCQELLLVSALPTLVLNCKNLTNMSLTIFFYDSQPGAYRNC